MKKVDKLPPAVARGRKGKGTAEEIEVIRADPGEWYEAGTPSGRTNFLQYVGANFTPFEATVRGGVLYIRWAEDTT